MPNREKMFDELKKNIGKYHMHACIYLCKSIIGEGNFILVAKIYVLLAYINTVFSIIKICNYH